MRPLPGPGDPLSIAYLTYRGKPHVGGQGVYTRHLTKALADLGHQVVVLSGQPYPHLDDRVELVKLPSLDIYNDHFPMRMPGLWELKDFADWAEVTSFSAGTFPEPLAFSIRAARWLADQGDRFDLVHDNQCLGYGLMAIERRGLPVLGTIHHPITVDRRVEMEHAEGWRARWGKRRWYRFTRMQTRVAKSLRRIITVSENSATDILADHEVDPERLHIVPVGVDPDLFRPLTGVEREPHRIISTASADVPMKGQRFLLEAVAKLRAEHDDVTLTIIGSLKDGSRTHSTLDRLGLRDCVTFVSGVSDERIVELYSEASVAVVPSLYEGFSLPAIEAMAAACPLVATTGGALPEVTGTDGDTCFQVPPSDADALVAGIRRVFAHPAEAAAVAERARNRVVENWSWKRTAERTVTHYRALLEESAAEASHADR
ncbi:MAG: glycosyltransferase family 4 protein [Microthrixaceae bacterium]|nr:glycosyltransferase family 4 protein [Microthrixaceae bacterium]